MMVLPSTLWNGAPPQAKVNVVRVADAGPVNPVNSVNDDGREPAHRSRDLELNQGHPFHTPVLGLSR